MKLIIFVLISFALILAVSSSSEDDDDADELINAMAKILNVKLDEDEILNQIPPNTPKATTLPVTIEMMEIVQKLRDHFGSLWNLKDDEKVLDESKKNY